MPLAPAVKGFLILTPIVVAAGAALWENPQFREWFDKTSYDVREWFFENTATPQERQRRRNERQRSAYNWEGMTGAPSHGPAGSRTDAAQGVSSRASAAPDADVVARATARVDAAKNELRRRAAAGVASGVTTDSPASGVSSGFVPTQDGAAMNETLADETTMSASLGLNNLAESSSTASSRVAVSNLEDPLDSTGVLVNEDPHQAVHKAGLVQSGRSTNTTTTIDDIAGQDARSAEILFSQPESNLAVEPENPFAHPSDHSDGHEPLSSAEQDSFISYSDTSSETGEIVATPEVSDDEFDVRSDTTTQTATGSYVSAEAEEGDDAMSVFSEGAWSEAESDVGEHRI